MEVLGIIPRCVSRISKVCDSLENVNSQHSRRVLSATVNVKPGGSKCGAEEQCTNESSSGNEQGNIFIADGSMDRLNPVLNSSLNEHPVVGQTGLDVDLNVSPESGSLMKVLVTNFSILHLWFLLVREVKRKGLMLYATLMATTAGE